MGSAVPNLSRLEMNLQGPYSAAAAVDLSSVDADYTAPKTPTGIYVGGAGNVKVDMQGGGTVTFTAPPVGSTLAVAVTKIYKTGTTATLLVALFHDPL